MNDKCSFSNCNLTFHSTYAVLNATAEIVQKSSATLAMKAWKYAEKLLKSTRDVLGKFMCVLHMLRTMILQYKMDVTVNIKSQISCCASFNFKNYLYNSNNRCKIKMAKYYIFFQNLKDSNLNMKKCGKRKRQK